MPIQPVPNQTLQVILGDQICQINLWQRLSGLYCDLYSAGELVIGGVVCRNINRIVRSLYLGFSGDLLFYDTQGGADPLHSGLGSRFLLIYLTASEVLAAEAGTLATP